ncbi:MAG TPA: hypothetical protein PLY78_02930 [Methanospirillum sp.]|nr:hypothetical protein [Methanospirillum sp.]
MVEKKDLLSRLKEFELKELESNELVQKILENEKERHLLFDLAGVPIKVVAAFPREVRYFYEQNRTRKEKDLRFSDIEADAYKIAAQLCLEAPFNTPQFWEYYDTMTGKFWGVFNAMYEGIEKNEEKIGDFRKK